MSLTGYRVPEALSFRDLSVGCVPGAHSSRRTDRQNRTTVMNIVGGSILSAATIPDSSSASASGMTVYIVVMLAAFAVATVIAVGISTRAGRTTPTVLTEGRR